LKNLLDALKAKPRDEYVTLPEEEAAPIDWQTIEDFEGGRPNKAYVPQAGKSGATVSAGFDVGQRSHLKGLPESIQEKLSPVLGLKRNDAERALSSIGGIELSPEESNTVADFAKNETEHKVRDYWEKNSDTPFDSLTPAQKTVLTSITHQYGNLSRTPRFARFAKKGEWDKVVQELRNFKDSYKTRRNKEADYLAQSMRTKK
jgi:type VI secretion system secreted protein VgrG